MLVRIPGNAPVGQWSVSVATWYGDKSMNESRHDMETFHATATDPFYVLFNPFSESMFFLIVNLISEIFNCIIHWMCNQTLILFHFCSKADAVYMSSHAGRNEYVLSEVGKVYAGTHNKIAGIDLVDVY